MSDRSAAVAVYEQQGARAEGVWWLFPEATAAQNAWMRRARPESEAAAASSQQQQAQQQQQQQQQPKAEAAETWGSEAELLSAAKRRSDSSSRLIVSFASQRHDFPLNQLKWFERLHSTPNSNRCPLS